MPDEAREKLIRLFRPLAATSGDDVVVQYIHIQTEVAPRVIREWLAGERSPSIGIQRAVFSCLADARPDQFPAPSPLSVLTVLPSSTSVPVGTNKPGKDTRLTEAEVKAKAARSRAYTRRRKDEIIQQNAWALAAIQADLRKRKIIK
jgi:hypothetical protein